MYSNRDECGDHSNSSHAPRHARLSDLLLKIREATRVGDYRLALQLCDSESIASHEAGTPIEQSVLTILRIQLQLQQASHESSGVTWLQTIENLTHCLKEFAQGDKPEVRALAEFVLGETFARAPRNQDTDNIERAIAHLSTALIIYRTTSEIETCGAIHHLLGVMYTQRQDGIRNDNLGKARMHLFKALQIFSRKRHSVTWAEINSDLALVYLLGENDDGDTAIRHLANALEELTPSQHARLWAHVHHRLGLAYRYHSSHPSDADLDLSIHHFEEACCAFERIGLQDALANTELALARVYSARRSNDKEQDYERIQKLLSHALVMFSKEYSPVEWAGCHDELAKVYLARAKAGVKECADAASQHFRLAEDVFVSLDLKIRIQAVRRRLNEAERLSAGSQFDAAGEG